MELSFLPQKGNMSPREVKGIVIGAPVAPTTLASVEEGPSLRDNDFILPSVDAPARELNEQEQLALAVKASLTQV